MRKATYTAHVIDAWPPTPSTRLVRLETPKGFIFRPGQSARLTVSAESGTHSVDFSIATGPERPFLEFATRYSQSPLKHAFFALEPGDTLQLEGPFDSLDLDSDRPAVMIAGGIGITPFRSMLQAIADRESHQRAVLVYANATPDEVAFMPELEILAGRAPGIEIIYTVSETNAGDEWTHRTGRIDGELLREVRERLPGARYYIAGPDGFVENITGLLHEVDIGTDDIVAEGFPGYDDYSNDAETLPENAPEPRKRTDWEERYRETPVEEMPWFHPDLDPDFEQALDRYDIEPGTALDLGTGPGTQAIGLALRGFNVTGADVSRSAVEKAADRARKAGVDVTFLQDDMLDSKLEERFHLVLDRGVFHTIDPEARTKYVATLHGLVEPGGTVLLKCFSYKETRPGPNRFSPGEIHKYFGDSFEILSIEETKFSPKEGQAPLALLCVMQPRG